MATPRVSAGALFTDDAGRVLMVRPTYKDYWDIPGGYVEPGESPYAACVREVREELSIAPPIRPQPLVVDWAPAEGEGDKILFVFGGELRPEDLNKVNFADGELSEFKFTDLSSLDDQTIPRLARRIRTAMQARAGDRMIYSEHGSEL